jgi:hypothetical protein
VLKSKSIYHGGGTYSKVIRIEFMKNLLLLLFTLFIFMFTISCGQSNTSNQASNSNTARGENKNPETTSATRPSSEDIRSILDETRRLEVEGRSMEEIRKNRDEAGINRCGEVMKTHKEAAEKLNEKAQKLPPIYKSLARAADEVQLCITCSPTAIKSCDQAKLLIQEAEKQQ